jgi:hypothetical protein
VTEAVAAYEAFKAEANRGEPPGDALSRRAVHFEHRIKELRNRRAAELDKALPDLDARLRGILSEGQLQIVETFRPCLVPPKDLKDPVRAGQAAGDRGVRMLAHLRRVPEPVWRARKSLIAERYVSRLGHGRVEITDAEARAAEKSRFIATIEKARALSDVAFEMEKETLAASMNPNARLEELIERSRVVRPKDRPRNLSAASRWLLHARIVPILEARLANGAHGT